MAENEPVCDITHFRIAGISCPIEVRRGSLVPAGGRFPQNFN